jgi:putative membrane protein
MRRALTALCLFAALAVPVAAGAQSTDVSEQDRTWLNSQQQTNLAEISLGKTVMEKANSESVKKLASDLVTGHTAVSEQNTALAQKLGITSPTEPSAEQKATAEKVLAKSGEAFDLAYVNAQIEGHQKSVASASKEMTSGSNADVKAFATSYVPKAQGHLDMSRTVLSQISAASAGADALPRTGRSTESLVLFGFAALLLGLGAVGLSRQMTPTEV